MTNYLQFEEQMVDILSSGDGFDLSDWHQKQLKELFDNTDKDKQLEYVNRFYSNPELEVNQILEGELSYIAELLEVDNPKIKITFGD